MSSAHRRLQSGRPPVDTDDKLIKQVLALGGHILTVAVRATAAICIYRYCEVICVLSVGATFITDPEVNYVKL